MTYSDGCHFLPSNDLAVSVPVYLMMLRYIVSLCNYSDAPAVIVTAYLADYS